MERMEDSPEILITQPLIKWLELDFAERDFSPAIFSNAMTFADVDNDGISEFVTGSMQGDLYIFKGLSSPKYWRKSTNLGMVTAVGAGDIMQNKKNMLYAVTGEGRMHCFVFPQSLPPGSNPRELDDLSRHPRGKMTIEPTYSQKIPPNIVMSILADIDNDGYPEILFGMTDRVVRSFKWVEAEGRFVTLNKWEFAGQIGNMSAGLSDGLAQIYVSQPGGCCCFLKAVEKVEESVLFEEPVYHNPAGKRTRSPLMQTKVLGGVCFDEQKPAERRRHLSADRGRGAYAVCSFDGTLMVCSEDRVLWELQTADQLIWIQHLPLRDEFLVAGCSGAVYIVDRKKRMMKLLARDPINGFVAGLYGPMSTKGSGSACTFATLCGAGKVVLYYDVKIPSLDSIPSFLRA